jgi:predicted metalloprotease with PDZ domain
MVHLSFPSMADEHHWIEEGLATYVEPISRIQAGQMTALQMWTDLARDMRKGVPNPDDKGLDHTHTWASTYWGGALFCFLADVEIREQTNNKKGLQDALRGILNAGGDIRYDWKLEEALKAGDRATGLTVLTDLYAKMKDRPMPVDLSTKWKQLGIESDGKTVHLNDDAPLAAIRRAITSPDTAKAGQFANDWRPSAVYAGRSADSAPRSTEH